MNEKKSGQARRNLRFGVLALLLFLIVPEMAAGLRHQVFGIEDQVRRLNESAAKHESEGDMTAAIEDLSVALSLNPADYASRYFRARLYRASGRLDKALEDCDRLAASSSGDQRSKALFLRGMTRIDREEYAAALADFDQLAAKDFGIAEYYAARARAAMGLKDYPKALTELSQAIAEAPEETSVGDIASLYLLRGMCFRDARPPLRDRERALYDFSTAIELDPDNGEALVTRAWMLGGIKEWQKGIDDAARALELAPKDISAMACLGWCYGGLGDIPAALKHYHEALSIQPDYMTALNNLAWLLATTRADQYRDGAAAIQYAEKAVELTKGRNHIYLDTMAAAYAEVGRFKDAAATQKKAIALEGKDADRDPTNSVDYKRRLRLYKSKKRYHE